MDIIDTEMIVELCNNVASEHRIVSACFYGSRVCGYAKENSDLDILLILEDYRNGVRYHYRKLNYVQVAILVIDKMAFEQDSKKGALGDFVSGRLIAPYASFINPDYMRRIELQTKERMAKEDLRDIVIEYGELSRGLVIRPEYLALTRMRNRAKAYPPLKYSYTRMLSEGLREKNMERILDGYVHALKNLSMSKIVNFEDGNITIDDDYVDQIVSWRIFLNRVVDIVKTSRRVFNAYVAHGKAGYVSIDIVAKELASKLGRELRVSPIKDSFEDPKIYLSLKTANGLVSMNESASLAKLFKSDKKITITPMSGVLNEVYLIEADGNRLVAKRFTDWYNFKWFLLNVVAYGTKTFTLSGRDRLSNEYVVNRLLAKNNISVPEIVSVSLPNRLLIQKFIEGTSVQNLVIAALRTNHLVNEQRNVAFKLGRTVADIHHLNVCLGDCKPENFILGIDGRIYTLDLEQGKKMGDKSWDIAEFLYYSGHYGASLTGGLYHFAESFIEGYQEIGEKEILRRATGLRYTRIFLLWTSLPIIQKIEELLKKA